MYRQISPTTYIAGTCFRTVSLLLQVKKFEEERKKEKHSQVNIFLFQILELVKKGSKSIVVLLNYIILVYNSLYWNH